MFDNFNGLLLAEQLKNDSDNFVVKRAFEYYSPKYDITIIVKRGFISDGASIPMFLRGIVRGTQYRYKRAFILHDALYRTSCNRKMADVILDEALKDLGMGAYTRSKIYYPLRAFGSPTTDEDMIENACLHVQVLD